MVIKLLKGTGVAIGGTECTCPPHRSLLGY